MKKQLKLRQRKLFRRYLGNFILILLIPCILFSFVYERYYMKAYRERIIERYQATLDKVCSDFMVLEENLTSIGYSLPLSVTVLRDYYYSDKTYSGIRSTLSGYTTMNPLLQSVDYYTYRVPDTVFTYLGTYNMNYYQKILGKDGEWKTLEEKVREIQNGSWFSAEQLLWDKYPLTNPVLKYILPIGSRNKRSFVLFEIRDTIVRQYVSPLENTNAEVLWNGNCLYRTTPLQGKGIVLTAGDKDGIMVRQEITDALIGTKLNALQLTYFFALTVVLLVGAAIASYFTVRSYQPIQNLEALARSNISIPEGVHELDSAVFAIEKLEEHNRMIKDRQALNRALLALTHGCATENLKHCGQLCAVLEHPAICIVLVENREQKLNFETVDDVISDCFAAEGMEYVEERNFVFVIGLDDAETEGIPAVLARAARELGEHTRIAMSGLCRQISELAPAFRQAIMLLRSNTTENVLIYGKRTNIADDDAEIVTEIDMRSLERAINGRDTEKIHVMMEVLIDTLDGCPNAFYASLMADNIIHSAVNALREAGGDGEFLRQILTDRTKAENLGDLIDILEDIAAYTFAVPEENNINILDVCQYIIENHKNAELNVNYLADKFNISASTLSRRFKSGIGMTLSEYIAKWQMEYSKELLRNTDLTVAKIGSMLGYTQASSFIRKFKGFEHITPVEYRNKMRGGENDESECNQEDT